MSGEVIRVNFGASQERGEHIPTEADLLKLEVFIDHIERGMTQVIVDATSEEVKVPPQFKERENLHLNFSLRFGVDDFDYDEYGVRSSLSFNGSYFFCDLPWKHVRGIFDPSTREGVMFAR